MRQAQKAFGKRASLERQPNSLSNTFFKNASLARIFFEVQMSVTFYFVRHAKPELQGVLLGHTDSPLVQTITTTPFADKLATLAIERVITSPLQRARHSAEFLCPAVSATIDKRLQECNFGQWDGKSYSWLWQHASGIGDFWQDPWQTSPPEGESMEKFSGRVTSFLHALLADPITGNTLVVSHAGVMKLIYFSLLGISRPNGNMLASLEFNYLSGFQVDVFYDELGKAWPKVVI
jgi:alpha-ribazole phosphatase